MADVLAAARRCLGEMDASNLERVPDTAAALALAGIPHDRFDWLYRMRMEQPAAFLVRWPLLGHAANHVGEMIGIRNRMELRQL